MVRVLGCCWQTGQVPLVLSLGPSWAQTVVWDPPLVAWGWQGQKPAQGPTGTLGLVWGEQEKRKWAVSVERLGKRGESWRERGGEERGRLQGWVATRKEVSSGACPRDAKPRAWVWQEGDPGKKDGHFAEHRWTKALKDKASGLHATPFSPAPR